jgi:hypothetical protein
MLIDDTILLNTEQLPAKGDVAMFPRGAINYPALFNGWKFDLNPSFRSERELENKTEKGRMPVRKLAGLF